MIKYLLALSGLLCVSAAYSQSQTLRIGNSIAEIGVVYCDYSASGTNNCTLSGTSGTLSGLGCQLSYNYTVLSHISINADAAVATYTGGTGIDAGVGAEYHFHISHKADPVDLYLSANGGYTRLSYAGGLVDVSGTFVAPGIYYQFGGGIRKYIAHSVGLFLNVNYAIHNYIGGQVKEAEDLKIPYTIDVSGFNFGGGICWKFGKSHHALVD